MSKGIQDLGSGFGYIYVTDPKANIIKVYDNNADGARKVKLDGIMASAVATNRVATAIVTIDAPTGVGTINTMSISGDKLNNNTIAYTGVTTANELTQLIVDEINSTSVSNINKDFTAVRIDNVLYILSNAGAGSSYNGATVVIPSTGFFTYTVDQLMEGGTSNSESYDEAIGYNFYLDADYGATQCSGGGVAVVTSITNASNITEFIVNKGFQNAMPLGIETLSSDSIVTDRKGVFTVLSLTGEGSSDDDLQSIIINDVAIGDRLLLVSSPNTISIKDGLGNIELQTATYDIVGESTIELFYNANNKWYEINRSKQVIGISADYRAAGYGIFSLEDYNSSAVLTTGTVTFVANTDKKYQKLTGASTLGANLTYQLDVTAEDGDEFWLEYDASVIVGAFTLSIFGITVTSSQALQGGLIFYSRFLNGSWYSHVYPNLNQGASNPFLVTQDLLGVGSVLVSKVETALKTEVITVPVSFEASEVGDIKVKIPYACTVIGLYAPVTKTLAGTDDATITPKNHAATAMTDGAIALTLSSTIGTGFTSTPTANNTFAAGEILTLTTAKTTAGGKGLVSVTMLKS